MRRCAQPALLATRKAGHILSASWPSFLKSYNPSPCARPSHHPPTNSRAASSSAAVPYHSSGIPTGSPPPLHHSPTTDHTGPVLAVLAHMETDTALLPPATQPPAPQLPLCRRPAVHVEPVHAVLAWRGAMEARITALGDSLERSDGGPDQEGLMRELDWALDDAVESFRPSPSSPWEPSCWRLLQPQLRTAATRGTDTSLWQLRMRERMDVMGAWWRSRLEDRVPFQYLLSSAHWHSYVLSVGPGVLVPRPETEIFPALVAAALAARPRLAQAPWADLGTGSGAIAIAAAAELRKVNPTARVYAVDLSPTAAAYAQFNAHLCLPTQPTGPPPTPSNPTSTSIPTSDSTYPAIHPSPAPHPHVQVVVGSWFQPLQPALVGRLGGVLSNPPYIPRQQLPGLQAEVGRHEPRGALDGGEGAGLESLEVLCSQAAKMLVPGGLIVLETAGNEQANLVADLLRQATLPDDDHATSADQQQQLNTALTRLGGGPVQIPGVASGVTSLMAASGGLGTVGRCGGVMAAFEDVEVLEDCYGVKRFVRAYRRE